MRQKTTQPSYLARRVLIPGFLFACLFCAATGLRAFAASDMDVVIDEMITESQQELIRSQLILNIEHVGLEWMVKSKRTGRQWTVVTQAPEVKELVNSLDPDRVYKCRALAVFTKKQARLVKVDSCKGVLRTDSLRR